ncbi:MAG: YjbQ family protein [Acidobacteria bacterium]|nr:YjbQ family protein [Acidobacteriota bacterium]
MSEKGLETAARGLATSEHTNGFRLRAETLTVPTRERVELINITDQLAARVRASGVRQGLALVNSLHTTLALFINEFQPALLEDIRAFLEQVVLRDRYYKHNDPVFSDCDRLNADAHLRAMLLGHSLALPIQNGELVLGTFQSVILAELDGPRERALQLHILGL